MTCVCTVTALHRVHIQGSEGVYGRGNARKKVSKFISKDMNVGIVVIDNLGSVGC